MTVALFLSGCAANMDTLLASGEQQATQVVKEEMDKRNQALLAAVNQGDKETIQKLLADGADINATDERGRTSAMIAVHTDQLEVFNLLVEHGANINIRDDRSDNPLLYAGAEGKLDFVRASIAAGADTTVTNRFGGTALIPAADRGHVEIVRELLTTSDVNIDLARKSGRKVSDLLASSSQKGQERQARWRSRPFFLAASVVQKTCFLPKLFPHSRVLY